MRTLLIVALLLAAACERETKEPAPTTAAQTTAPVQKNIRALAPGDQVLAYYKAMGSGRVHDAYDMVHAPDREAKSLDEFRTAANDPLQVKLIQKRTYTVKNEAIDEAGKTARVDIDTTGPDVAKLQKTIIPQLMMAKNGVKPTADELKTAMQRALDGKDVPMMVTNNTLYLAQNEAGEWKLDFDWDADRSGREVPIKRKLAPDAGQ